MWQQYCIIQVQTFNKNMDISFLWLFTIYIFSLVFNLIKITSLTWSSLLIWSKDTPLWVTYKWPYVMNFAVQWKWPFWDYESIIKLNTKLLCYEQPDLAVKGHKPYLSSWNINDIGSLAIEWPIMVFLQISQAMIYR